MGLIKRIILILEIITLQEYNNKRIEVRHTTN